MKYKRVYILNIPNVVTGGPEALFQLSHEMISLGVDCRTIFMGDFEGNPIDSHFSSYKCSWDSPVEIDEDTLCIIPEVATSLLYHPLFAKAKMAVWWLSVDNNNGTFSDFQKEGVIHLYQSNYACNFLRKNQVQEMAMLFEPINQSYFDYQKLEKKNKVCYSIKGESVALAMQKDLPQYEFVMLKGMTRDEVKRNLADSKLFIDFGHHPGRDRLPRESVTLGTCLLTSRKGSAALQSDVCIPTRFKFYLDESHKIKRAIQECVDNYELVSEEFDAYRNVIRQEKDVFVQQICNLLKIQDA
jgi:hypothetical protein